jgi:hypothetical protein
MRIVVKELSDSVRMGEIIGRIWDKSIFGVFWNMNHAYGMTWLDRG